LHERVEVLEAREVSVAKGGRRIGGAVGRLESGATVGEGRELAADEVGLGRVERAVDVAEGDEARTSRSFADGSLESASMTRRIVGRLAQPTPRGKRRLSRAARARGPGQRRLELARRAWPW
jgi:hypothetical protein